MHFNKDLQITSLHKVLKLFKKVITTGIRINIGSGNVNSDNDWLNTDKNTLDILLVEEWEKYLLFFKAQNIMAEHVWEHFWLPEIKLANANCYKFLKKGGKLRLAVPDGFFPDKEYIENVRPGGKGFGAADHKILFNYKTLQKLLEETGFKVILLEYWDENGEFHYQEWDDKEGFISRSSKHDKRNMNGFLRYTSIIIDAIKE